MRHDGEAIALRLGKDRVGRDHREGGVFLRAAFGADGQIALREMRGQTVAAEFAILFEGCRPEMRTVANGDGADGVHYHDRADGDAAARLRRSRADAAFQRGGGGAETGARAAEREVGSGAGRGLIAEVAVGRKTAPVLVAAIEQIEQNRARDDRYHGVADAEAAALLAHVGLHAGGGVEAESRAAG